MKQVKTYQEWSQINKLSVTKFYLLNFRCTTCKKKQSIALRIHKTYRFDFTKFDSHKIIMAYKPAKKIEDADILKLQKEFLECDLDGDGKITREELKDVLRSLKGKM